MTTRSLSVLAAVAICLGIAGTAHAQYAPPPPGGAPIQPVQPAVIHDGFMIGFSSGLGMQSFDCNGCDSENGFAFDFSIGGFIRHDLAIMYDVVAVMHFHEDFNDELVIFTNSINTLAAQKWVGPQMWVKGGIGFARFFATGETDVDENSSVSGLGLMAAGGYEISQSGNFAFDVKLRIAAGFYDEDGEDIRVTNVAALLGVNWY